MFIPSTEIGLHAALAKAVTTWRAAELQGLGIPPDTAHAWIIHRLNVRKVRAADRPINRNWPTSRYRPSVTRDERARAAEDAPQIPDPNQILLLLDEAWSRLRDGLACDRVLGSLRDRKSGIAKQLSPAFWASNAADDVYATGAALVGYGLGTLEGPITLKRSSFDAFLAPVGIDLPQSEGLPSQPGTEEVKPLDVEGLCRDLIETWLAEGGNPADRPGKKEIIALAREHRLSRDPTMAIWRRVRGEYTGVDWSTSGRRRGEKSGE